MVWQLLAMWAIVLGTCIWFARDERRLARERLEAEALTYSTAPAWRHRDTVPSVAQDRIQGGLNETQRRFFAELQRAAQKA